MRVARVDVPVGSERLAVVAIHLAALTEPGGGSDLQAMTTTARTEGDELVILESMKMEIPVEAPCSGTLVDLRVREGQNVEEGAVLAVIE